MKRTYRGILKEIFEARTLKNPSYSISAFSRDAGYKSYHISDILRGKYNLSPKSALKIASNLKMNDSLCSEFLCLVEIEFAKDPIKKNLALKKLSQLKSFSKKTVLQNEFNLISEWYYFAIIELVRQNPINLDFKSISKKLDISINQAEIALNQLTNLGIINIKNNRYSVDYELVKVNSSNAPSDSIRKYHKTMIKKGLEAIEDFEVSERSLSSFNLLLEEKEYENLRSELNEYVRKYIHKIQINKEKNAKLYALNFQLFPHEKKEKVV